MQLGDFSSWLADIQRQAGAFVGKAESYIISAVSNFRDKRGQLNFQLTKLRANPPLTSAPDSLRQEYREALAAAEDTKTKADWLGKLADTFTNITGLGAVPALIAGVPVAVMLAGIAALTVTIVKISQSVSHYMAARQVVETAMREGKDASSALDRYNRANPQGSGGIFGDASKLVWPVAISLGLYLLISNKRR